MQVEAVRLLESIDWYHPDKLHQAIRTMYNPGQLPETVAKWDEELRRLQRLPTSWKLGNDLLDSEDERVRFFGALTLTVKINNDWFAV
jgi:hypothetical protein